MNYDYKFVIHTYDFPLILICAILCKVKKYIKYLPLGHTTIAAITINTTNITNILIYLTMFVSTINE